MKRSFATAFLLASAMSLSALAQSSAPASAAPSKVAVIAFQAAVSQTNEFQRNYADLEKKFMPKRAELKTLNDEIETMSKQLQDQSATLSPSERTSRTAALDAKKKQLQRGVEDAQSDFEQQLQDMFKNLAPKVYAVMTSYARKQGYSVVLDASQEQNPVLYAVESVNITKPVLDAYNEKSGVPAPPAVTEAPAPQPDAHPAGHSRTTSH